MEGRSSFNRKEIFRKPMRKWEDDIRIDYKEIGIKTRNWGD
jgi:hypothetical protein